MRLIESKVEYIPQEEGLEGIYKMIEVAGRTAYNSQDKITPDSAKDFVDRMIKSNHGAALEHGTVYLSAIPWRAKIDYNISPWIRKHSNPKFDTYQQDCLITCNYRMLVENNCLDDLQYLCSPTKFHEKRYTMRFTCSRAIAQELTRHRVFSFLMESQRYINYSKEKHGGEITFIIPSWYDEKIPEYYKLIKNCQKIEEEYMELIEWGCTPQEARDILPNATKTELIMTGFASDWKHLLDLRYFEKTGKVHPDMKLLMEKLKDEAIKYGIWNSMVTG